jgi:hypothetical protein
MSLWLPTHAADSGGLTAIGPPYGGLDSGVGIFGQKATLTPGIATG